MGYRNFEAVRLLSPVHAETACLRQSAPRWPEVMRFIVIAPLGFLLAKALMMFSGHIWANSAAKASLLANPVALMQIAIAFLAFLTVFLWQISIAVTRLAAKRTVAIDAKLIQVTDRTLFGRSRWSMPTASYAGVLHQTRTTLGGPQLTATLVHDDPGYSILLASGADRGDIDHLCKRFGWAELSPGALALRQHRQKPNQQVSGTSYGALRQRQMTDRRALAA